MTEHERFMKKAENLPAGIRAVVYLGPYPGKTELERLDDKVMASYWRGDDSGRKARVPVANIPVHALTEEDYRKAVEALERKR